MDLWFALLSAFQNTTGVAKSGICKTYTPIVALIGNGGSIVIKGWKHVYDDNTLECKAIFYSVFV